MEAGKAKLIGQLIGLARATDGNEHLRSPEAGAVIRQCLSAAPESEDKLQELLGGVEAVKRAMVPDCFLCANPCGKTAAFDLRELEILPAEEQAAKLAILEALLNATSQTPEAALYRGLIALGMEGLPISLLNAIEKELTA